MAVAAATSGFETHLPALLLQAGPMAAPLWQWLLLALLAATALPVGLALARLTRRALRRVTSRSSSRIDDVIVAKTRGPLMFAWAIALLRLSIPWLGLDAAVVDFSGEVLHTGLLIVLLWSLARGVDVAREAIAASPWAEAQPASRALIRLGARIAKLAVLAAAAVMLLAQMGYPVASLLAGLGIGGIALALAAQKTVENLFGAFSLGVDRPFREGDFVRVEDFVGTVEAIGIRSTRFRTLDRTLITIPNGKLSEIRLESFSARDRIRLACTVGLVYETTAAQMREVLAGLERVLREHPKIWTEVIVVRFAELAESSLNIEVMAWFETTDWNEFQLIRQEVLLRFMEVVERAGTGFAFPTCTVHLVPEGA
jgi:MscS family membrane protein